MSLRETGLKSESTSKAGEHFSMGVMLTLFHRRNETSDGDFA